MKTNPNEDRSGDYADLVSALQNLSPLPSSIDPMQAMFDAGVARGKWISSQKVSPRESVSRPRDRWSRGPLALVASLFFLATTVVLVVSTWQLRSTNRTLASQLNQLERNEIVRNQDEKRGIGVESFDRDSMNKLVQSPATETLDSPGEFDESVSTDLALPASQVIWMRGVALRPSDEFRNPRGGSFFTADIEEESEAGTDESDPSTHRSLMKQRLRSYDFQGL